MANRRVILSSLWLALGPLGGCATPYPKRGLSSLPAKAVTLEDPRYEPTLRLKISDWARPISASALRDEEAEINNVLGPWADIVVGRFSEAVTSSLRTAGFKVYRVARGNSEMSEEAKNAPSIRSFLTAGFVYKTIASATYAPFVQVVLEAALPGNGASYHQLYAAADRSLNLFTTTLPPSTEYVFTEISSLRSERNRALDALATLAEQLAQRFATELAA